MIKGGKFMINGSNGLPLSSSKLIIIMIIAIIAVVIATVALNGGVSTPVVEENTSDVNADNNTTTYNQDYKMIGNNSYGAVTKISGFGNPSSDIRVAFILGVDAQKSAPNSIVPTLQNDNELNYCYDVYIINTTNTNQDSATSNNQNNLTLNEKSESLASEYVVPDVVNNNYNFTVDVHSTNDSNSYVFVPSENTYTSKKVVEYISNNTNVGIYTPTNPRYTDSVSKPIISYEIPSIVYVSREYYSNSSSAEVNTIIHAIDNFDFVGLFSDNSDSSSSTNDTSNNVVVTSNSNGNKEVN